VIVVVVLLPLWLASPAAVNQGIMAAVPAGATAITISSPLPQVGSLSVSARYVAWTATKVCTGGEAPEQCAPRVLYLYDIVKGQLRVAARTRLGATGAIYHYHVSDHWLVYLDTGVGNAPSALTWRIEVVDLATGRTSLLARSVDTDMTAVPPDLSLAGATLVWTSAHPVGEGHVECVVSVTNLATGATRVVARTTTPYTFSFPDTDGRHAVWEQDDYTSAQPSSRILGTDITAPQPAVRVLSGEGFASQPAVRGDAVVWKAGPGFAPGQIMLASWAGGAPPRLISGPAATAFSPVIGDSFVAWATGATGKVTIYDLRTGRVLSPGGVQRDWIFGFPTANGAWLGYTYMTGVPPEHSSTPPRGYITLRYMGGDAGSGAGDWAHLATG
jgi:hypothetical protein